MGSSPLVILHHCLISYVFLSPNEVIKYGVYLIGSLNLVKHFFSHIAVMLLLVSSGKLLAQAKSDSIVSGPEVTVYGNRLQEFDAGVKVLTTDSAAKERFRNNNLTSFLEENTNIYIKSYGIGSLSTTAFRGASASQTSVLWNGFNIQSPMNGTLDLALVPVSLVDQVKVQFGGCGALWGSGSVSGSIHLDQKPYYNKGLSLRYGVNYGSFQNLSHIAAVSYSKKKWIVSVKGFLNNAKNNFPYTNTAQYGEPHQRQTNAALQQYGYMMDHYFKISRRDQLSFRVWQQYSSRQIPPTMLGDLSDAVQKDWFVRLSSEWQHNSRKATYNVRAAYFDEYLLYKEKAIATNSLSHSICQITEAETKRMLFGRGLLNVGINNTYTTAKVDAYQGVPFQNRSALFASFKYSGKKENWKINAGARKEVISGSRYSKLFEVPIMPFAGADLWFTKKLMLKTNASRNYRVPTFNDLYWNPGGNPNLKPEQGWSEELGLNFIHQIKECTGDQCAANASKLAAVNLSSTVFNRNIDNWIMWIPIGNYWSPTNIMKVWSRGIENSADVKFNLNPIMLKLGVRYDYTLSTGEKVAPGHQNELHQQLIYVPPHKASFIAGLAFKGYSFTYTQHYTSWVFTQADDKTFIDPYWIGNFVCSKTYALGGKGASVNFLFKVNNIWNTPYQVIAYRAMPGRNFEIGMSIQYNQISK